MKCPKCEEGTITRIILKKTNAKAILCDNCEVFWLLGEVVNNSSGHDFYTLGDNEYMIDSTGEADPEHTSPKYTHVK